jgi:dihydropteroate synthase
MSVSAANQPVPESGVARGRILRCGSREIVLGGEPVMVGILNVTPDSFFDGGRFAAVEAAVGQAVRLAAEGAVVIDIGGQSTRPGFQEISDEEEIARVIPVITALAKERSMVLSIDTYKPAVARAALASGAHVVNDIHGFQRHPELATLAAESGAASILMHNDPAMAQASGDVIEALTVFFRRSIDIATRAGVSPDRLVLDPGIGFGKTPAQNLAIIARIGELHALGFPLLLGASRKSTIGKVLDLPVEERLEGTLATTAIAAWQGVDFFRVHDVRANLRAARMAVALRRSTFS